MARRNKVIDLAEVMGAKLLQSGTLRFYCAPHSSRESYPFISNIRIADAGLSERDLSVGGIEEPKTTKAQVPPNTKPQPSSTTAAPKAGTMSIQDFGTYHALLIAVEDYTDPSVTKLDNPVKDALQLQKTLTTSYHFEPQNVKLLKNPSKKEVFTELARLRAAVKETDNLLVFYAGHGYWDKDMEKGYWLPTDAERDLPTNWIANEDVTGYMRAIKSKHTLLISDACFSGGIFKTREAFTGQRAVEEVYKMPSRKAITSGNLTLVPDKSVFIQYLVKKLEENKEKFLTEEQLFSQFKTAVINNSPGQIPQFGTIINTGDEGGNFIFIRK
ncbi:MAG: caspase family protein [Haliscomenobacter sp.]|nr:caspase family protein [Haliscomenobacter sp.]